MNCPKATGEADDGMVPRPSGVSMPVLIKIWRIYELKRANIKGGRFAG
jgi:hypothetical protein